MALLAQPGQAPEQAQQPNQQPDMAQAGSEGEQASEQEQLVYEYFSEQAQAFIHDEQSADFVADKIKQSGDPIEGIAEVAAVTYRRLEVQNPQEVDLLHSVTMEVVEDIITELINLASGIGLLPDEQLNEQVLSQIMEKAVAKYMEIESQGGDDPQTKQAQLQELLQSDEAQQGMNAMSNEAKANMQQWLGNGQGGQANG